MPKWLTVPAFAALVLFFVHGMAGAFLRFRVARATGGRVLVSGPVFLPRPGLKVRTAVIADQERLPVAMVLEDVRLERDPPGWSGTRPWEFTLTGAGRVDGEPTRETTVSGRVSGSFSRGSYRVRDLTVRIRGLGEAAFSGDVELKGPESRFTVDLKDLSLAELGRTLELPESPAGGALRGRAELVIDRDSDGWTARSVLFDLAFRDLSFAGRPLQPLSGRAAGVYDFERESGTVEEAVIIAGPDGAGGRIDFSGTIGREGFDLSFEAKDIFLEDIIEALPESLREKMGLKVEMLSGSASYSSSSEEFYSDASFRFFDASGRGRLDGFPAGDEDGVNYRASLAVEGLDLLSLSSVYGGGAVISGRANLDCELALGAGGIDWLRVSFETVPERDVRQYLNFRAVKALVALSTDTPLRMFSEADYGYRKIAGEIFYHDDYLRIIGRARQEADRNYLLLGTVFGRHVNVAVDPRFNTVRLADLRRRLDRLF